MITAIIQARMGSSRLPGKVLKKFSGDCLIGHIMARLKHSRFISKIIVATTINQADDILVDWLNSRQVAVYRGSEQDVLERYYEAANYFEANNIIRITSDDPFKDPEIIDKVAQLYFNQNLDFAYNNNPPTFAEGLDTEIFSYDALRRAHVRSKDPFEREHVTQHFFRNQKDFKQKNLVSPINYSYLRWTIDDEEDLEMTRIVYEKLYSPGKIFLAQDILDLLEREPTISLINQNVKRSDMYKNRTSI